MKLDFAKIQPHLKKVNELPITVLHLYFFQPSSVQVAPYASYGFEFLGGVFLVHFNPKPTVSYVSNQREKGYKFRTLI